jgi:hypothetical protein
MGNLNEEIIGGELRENPSLFEVSKYFVDKLGSTKHWEKAGIWNGGEKIKYSEDELVIELAKDTAAHCLTGILRSEKGANSQICSEFDRFVHKYLEAGRLNSLHELVTLARSNNIARIQQGLAGLYTEIEQAFLSEKRTREYSGKTISEVDVAIRGKVNKARRNTG